MLVVCCVALEPVLPVGCENYIYWVSDAQRPFFEGGTLLLVLINAVSCVNNEASSAGFRLGCGSQNKGWKSELWQTRSVSRSQISRARGKLESRRSKPTRVILPFDTCRPFTLSLFQVSIPLICYSTLFYCPVFYFPALSSSIYIPLSGAPGNNGRLDDDNDMNTNISRI